MLLHTKSKDHIILIILNRKPNTKLVTFHSNCLHVILPHYGKHLCTRKILQYKGTHNCINKESIVLYKFFLNKSYLEFDG